jgi:hypothetical protein
MNKPNGKTQTDRSEAELADLLATASPETDAQLEDLEAIEANYFAVVQAEGRTVTTTYTATTEV